LSERALFQTLPDGIDKIRDQIFFEILSWSLFGGHQCMMQEPPHASRSGASDQEILDKKDLLILA